MRPSTLDLTFVTVLIAAIAYFVVDGWFGVSGMGRLATLNANIAEKQAEVAALEKQRDSLQLKAQGLSGPVIDRDLLDERLRATFGVGQTDERLIITPEQPE